MQGSLVWWREAGFGLGTGHEACDAELTAIMYGLILLLGRRQEGVSYTTFTDSTAAMTRVTGDGPGPGQSTAIRIIDLAQRLVDRGNSITIKWTPAHRGVEGNERADQKAKEVKFLPS